jgi:hypothetical protein
VISADGRQKVVSGSNTFVRISLLLAPCIAGMICVLFDRVDRGGAWWMFGDLAVIPALLGLLAAIVMVVVQGFRRRIVGGFLVAACVEIVAIGGGWIYSTQFLRNDSGFFL